MKTIDPERFIELLANTRDWHCATQDASYDHRVAIAICTEIIDAVKKATKEENQP